MLTAGYRSKCAETLHHVCSEQCKVCFVVYIFRKSDNISVNTLVIQKLEQFGTLSARERRCIEGIDLVARQLESDQDLVREGDQASHCPFLLNGFACCYKTLESGQRQIMAFYVPGDLGNLTSLLLGKQDHSIGTLTPAKVVLIPQAVILDWMRQHPKIAEALWRAALIDAAVSREWIVNVGRRTAYQRTAHLLCEWMLRMRAAGLARGLACEMPLTQVELADALGLTSVHVNRTLQWLRSDGLIELGGGSLKVRSLHELKQAAGFDPTYLHQPVEA